jgi:hypothetical protein
MASEGCGFESHSRHGCLCLFCDWVRWRPCDGLIPRPRSPYAPSGSSRNRRKRIWRANKWMKPTIDTSFVASGVSCICMWNCSAWLFAHFCRLNSTECPRTKLQNSESQPHLAVNHLQSQRDRERERERIRKKVVGGSGRRYIWRGCKKLHLRFCRFPGSARSSFW